MIQRRVSHKIHCERLSVNSALGFLAAKETKEILPKSRLFISTGTQ